MRKLDYKIIEATPEWADKYRSFCQKVYQTYYPRPERGITEDLFSEKVFNAPRITMYYQSLFSNTEGHKVWLAIDNKQNILGGAAGERFTGYCEMKAFYVSPSVKGQGIGRQLYGKVLEFAEALPIQVDVVEYMEDTIDMYKHWGFVIDESKGKVLYPWEEWPESAREAYQAIYMVKPAG